MIITISLRAQEWNAPQLFGNDTMQSAWNSDFPRRFSHVLIFNDERCWKRIIAFSTMVIWTSESLILFCIIINFNLWQRLRVQKCYHFMSHPDSWSWILSREDLYLTRNLLPNEENWRGKRFSIATKISKHQVRTV